MSALGTTLRKLADLADAGILTSRSTSLDLHQNSEEEVRALAAILGGTVDEYQSHTDTVQVSARLRFDGVDVVPMFRTERPWVAPAPEPIFLELDGVVMKTTADNDGLADLLDYGWEQITREEAMSWRPLDDDGTEAEALAEVETPRRFTLNQRVQVIEPEHPLHLRTGRVYKDSPDSLGRIRVDIDRAPDGMHDGWHAIEAWCLVPIADDGAPAFPDVLVHGRARAA